MPDDLRISVNGPTNKLVGPPEARDMYFMTKALETPANPGLNWSGLAEAGNDFVAMGHSQGA
jgi:hypothetical protein